MNSKEIAIEKHDDGKAIVVDQEDDGVVEVYDIGFGEHEIASYSYMNGDLTKEAARALAKEYALGWVAAMSR